MLAAPYSKAHDICKKQGGVLAAPDSEAENAQLVDLLPGSEHDRLWLGISDGKAEGTWSRHVRLVAGDFTYYSDEPATYVNWAAGQPDGGAGENCAEMWSTGVWNDAPCGAPKPFACDVPQPPREHFVFPCSERVASRLADVEQTALPSGGSPLCTYRIFGANGIRPHSEKKDFTQCRATCEALAAGAGMVAEPRNAQQRLYLARALRDSKDDSLWVGLTMGAAGWQWVSSGEAVASEAASWAHGQPDNDGSCVEQWADATWNDRGCDGDFYSNKVCACEVPESA